MGIYVTFSWILTVHVRFAFLSLGLFWLPLLVRKGGRTHVLSGRIFAGCTLMTLTTAFIVAGWRFIDPIWTTAVEEQPSTVRATEFIRSVRMMSASLGAMALYTLIPLVLAIQVVRNRRNAELFPGSGTRWLLWSQYVVGLALIVYAWAQWVIAPGASMCVVPLGVGIAGLGSAWWDQRFGAKPRIEPMIWLSKHMEFMLRIGIAYHTVFAMFALTPWLRSLGWASWALVIPMVLPAAVGLPAICLWGRFYRQKLAQLPADPREQRAGI